MFGWVGCGGLRALKGHQYRRSYTLFLAIPGNVGLIMTILFSQPKWKFWLSNRIWSRVVAASDAVQEAHREGSCFYGGLQLLGQEKPSLLTFQLRCLVVWLVWPRFTEDCTTGNADDSSSTIQRWFIDDLAELTCPLSEVVVMQLTWNALSNYKWRFVGPKKPTIVDSSAMFDWRVVDMVVSQNRPTLVNPKIAT